MGFRVLRPGFDSQCARFLTQNSVRFLIVIQRRRNSDLLIFINCMSKILFDDKDVTITDKEVIIKCYFFPFGNSKRIPYRKIRTVEMKNFAWKGKIWGMNVTEWGYWMPGDLKRWDYDRFIALETGSSITPSFTCTNMNEAYRIIQEQLHKYREGSQGK